MAYPPGTCKICGVTFERRQTVGFPRAYCYECRPQAAPRPFMGPCSVEGCGRNARSYGWCMTHYKRWQVHGDVQADRPVKPMTANKGLLCRVGSCDREARSHQYCKPHYLRLVVHGDVMEDTPIKTAAGEYIDSAGYRIIHSPEPGHPNEIRPGWIYEHRWVMADHIGRALVKGENVHHMNGDRLDNRLENLELWVTMQPSGQRVKDKLVWAREIVTRYEPIEELI